jgi:Kef-type K+ transport system membrane component KefB
MEQTGITVNPVDIAFLIAKVLGLFGALLIVGIIFLPRIVAKSDVWKAKGSIEAVATAAFFGMAALASYVGLSPIVGAFAAGMALATTGVVKRLEEYVGKLEFIFAPLFFAIIGAQVDLSGVDLNVLLLASILIGIAIISKVAGCGLPAMIFLRSRDKGMKVGVGMVSRGEVGLIVAGIGVTSGVLSGDIYTAVILMVVITTIITPVWLKITYKKDEIQTT